MHWPSSHPRQFTNATELRKHWEMAVGHKDVGAQIPLTGVPRDKALAIAEMVLRGIDNFAEPVLQGDVLIVYKPKSVKFESLNSREASSLFDDVANIIEQETGLKAVLCQTNNIVTGKSQRLLNFDEVLCDAANPWPVLPEDAFPCCTKNQLSWRTGR